VYKKNEVKRRREEVKKLGITDKDRFKFFIVKIVYYILPISKKTTRGSKTTDNNPPDYAFELLRKIRVS